MERKNFLNNAQDLVPPKNDTPYKRILIVGDIRSNVHAEIKEKFSMNEQDFEYLLWERANFLSKDRGYYGAAMVIV